MRRMAIAGLILASSAAWAIGGAQALPLGPGAGLSGGVAPATVQTVQWHRHHRGWGGAGVAAGVAGLAAGALIGSAIANRPGAVYEDGPYPVYGEPVYGGDPEAYCASRYKSWDPVSGTYLGYDGFRHPCP